MKKKKKKEEEPAFELTKLEEVTPEVMKVFEEQIGRGEAPIYERADGSKLCLVRLDFRKSHDELLEGFMAYLEEYVFKKEEE
jgi:hypothetical protein